MASRFNDTMLKLASSFLTPCAEAVTTISSSEFVGVAALVAVSSAARALPAQQRIPATATASALTPRPRTLIPRAIALVSGSPRAGQLASPKRTRLDLERGGLLR